MKLIFRFLTMRFRFIHLCSGLLAFTCFPRNPNVCTQSAEGRNTATATNPYPYCFLWQCRRYLPRKERTSLWHGLCI